MTAHHLSAREVLEERARLLARPTATQAPGDTLELLCFALAGEVYAVEARFVCAVFRVTDVSPLPGAPPPVFGVTGWRGELLTILDLRRLLDTPAAPITDLNHVIVLGDERPTFGILSGEVRGIVALSTSAVREPAVGIATGGAYLRGITVDAVQVLDGSKLLRGYR